MSKIALSGNASGTGTFTLASPNSNSDRTLDLPDAGGTLLLSSSNTNFPTGSVLQVVYGSTSTQVANTTTTYTDTGLTATITPKSASSKILVIVTQSCYRGGTATGVNIKLFRGATDLGQYVKDEAYTGNSTANVSTTAFQRLDTPNTTSPTTYKTQFANSTAVATAFVQTDNVGVSTITLMEIAG
jgi:hypothetical protein